MATKSPIPHTSRKHLIASDLCGMLDRLIRREGIKNNTKEYILTFYSSLGMLNSIGCTYLAQNMKDEHAAVMSSLDLIHTMGKDFYEDYAREKEALARCEKKD
jgi:hypothetical protein